MSLDADQPTARSDQPSATPPPAVQSAPTVVDPPKTVSGILRRLGPGLILAGSIVGSGELIATTKAGAQAGIALLWLILVGCVIKVFVQIEMGRHTIIHGETSLSALNRLPGPRWRANWVLWCWAIMISSAVAQQGGIVGGVGQAMAITFPVTGDYLQAIQIPSEKELKRYLRWEDDFREGARDFNGLSPELRERVRRAHDAIRDRLARLGDRADQILHDIRAGKALPDPWTKDDKIWAAVIAVLTAWLLYWGRYRSIQNISTVLVASFTFITIGNVVALHTTPQWSLSLSDYWRGLTFQAPDPLEGVAPWMTALAAFGIIGVGASELIAYPYWCLEKGYARFTGRKEANGGWIQRARGWTRVMRIDAFACMVLYTIATVAFFLMGVAVLHRDGLDPEGMRMVSTLAEAYVPVFGAAAKWLFLTGAIAVLYSTFLVSNAAHARLLSDGGRLFGLVASDDEPTYARNVAFLSLVLPLVSLGFHLTGANPVALVLLSGTMQAAMLPILSFAALYFRYRETDPALRPSPLWDAFLILSCIGMTIAGVSSLVSRFVQTSG